MRAMRYAPGFITRAAIIALIAALLVPAFAPLAASDSPDTLRLSAIQAARLLLKVQKWREAVVILERLNVDDETTQIEWLFLLGIAETRLGELRSAAQRFEAILALQPNLTRARLELARVYHALGRDAKARFHFNASLADRLPASAEEAVQSYLDALDTRKRWSTSLSFSVLPESNPLRRTGNREIRIGELAFQLDDDALAASGTGLLISVGGQYSPLLGEDLRGVLSASAASKTYRNDDWNDHFVQSDLGIRRLFEHGEVAGGLRINRRWFGGERFSRGIGPWVRGHRRLSAQSSVDFTLDAERRRHAMRSDLDGHIHRLRAGFNHAFSPTTRLRLAIELADTDSDERRHSHSIVGLTAALSHAFAGGLTLSPRLTVQRRRHAAPNPLFQETRSDRLTRLSVDLLHRRLQYRGFAPYLGYSYEVNRSNIPINEYTNRGVVLGISRNF